MVVVVVMMMKIMMMLFQTFHLHVLCLVILSGLQVKLTVSLIF
jgi:hypothetical protein